MAKNFPYRRRNVVMFEETPNGVEVSTWTPPFEIWRKLTPTITHDTLEDAHKHASLVSLMSSAVIAIAPSRESLVKK